MNTSEILKPIKTLTSKLTLAATVNFVLFLGGIVCITLGCMALKSLDPELIPLATTGLGSGLVLMLATRIDRFESFKALGVFEAKTRELKETITEANETLIQLRKLAEISGKTLNSLVAKVGRSFKVKETHETAQEIKKILTELKSDQDSIAHALQPWVQSMCSELAERLTMAFNSDYYAIEQSVIDQLQGIHSLPDDPHPERDKLIKRRESIEQHKYKAFEVQKLPFEDVLANLRKHVSTAPEAGEQLKAQHLNSIESWAEEVNYLLKFNDLKSPQRWTDIFIR